MDKEIVCQLRMKSASQMMLLLHADRFPLVLRKHLYMSGMNRDYSGSTYKQSLCCFSGKELQLCRKRGRLIAIGISRDFYIEQIESSLLSHQNHTGTGAKKRDDLSPLF